MPSEIRYLMFTPEEATSALKAYCNSSGRSFPKRAHYFHLEGGPLPLVRISSAPSVTHSRTTINFSADELLRPLLLFCRRRRIRLPANGVKDVIVHNDRLTLTVTLRWWRQEREAPVTPLAQELLFI